MAEKKKTKLNFKFKKPSRGVLIGLRVFLCLVIATILFLATAQKLNIASVTDITDSLKNTFSTAKPGPGYPYQINSNSVKDMTVLNGDIFVLTTSNTISLDTTAKEVKKTEHTYSNPAMNTKGSKAVVYNRNGTRFRIENRTDTLFTGETENEEKIITAAMGEKGNLAIATFSDSAASKLYVYSSNYKNIVFSWTCSQDSITSVDLSDNGKYAAVCVVGAREGEIYSKVVVFDFDYSEAKAEFEYPGTALLAVRFVQNDNVVAIGDDRISFIKNLKEKEDTEYGTATLSNFAFSEDGFTVLALSEHGSKNNETLYCFSDNFSTLFKKQLDSNVKSVFMYNGRISVLLEDMVYVYRTNGVVYRKYETDNTAARVFNLGSKTYLYSMGEITKCK